jgi:hypothetical protein
MTLSAAYGAQHSARLAIIAAVLIASGGLRVAAQPAATISASPNPVPAGAGHGATTVTWTTGDGSPGEVYVTINAGREILFAGASARGAQRATWIGTGDVCEFRLYSGTSHAERLATVVVTRAPAGSSDATRAATSEAVESPPLATDATASGSDLAGTLALWQFIAVLFLSTGAVALVIAGWERVQPAAVTRAGSGVEQVFRAVSRSRWVLWLWIATVVFLIANQALVRGRGVGLWDAETAFYPYQALVADHARAGRFVSWDPWSSGGLPASGEPQVGAYSPIAVFVGLLLGGSSAGFITYWLLMWWLGGFAIFMLGRALRAPAWGACVVALGFLFCGVYTGQAENLPLIAAFSFLPLVISRIEAAFAGNRLDAAAEAGALWGLSALAGYPGLVIITGGMVGLWALGRWLCGDDDRARSTAPPDLAARKRPPRRFLITVLAVFGVVGLIVLSPTYVAFFFDGAGSHTRVDVLSREIAVGVGALHPGALSTFASPYLATLKLRHLDDLWIYTDPSMVSVYAGAAMPILALLALAARPRERWRWWVLAIALLSLGCALGQVLPLRGWLYDWVYPTRFFRHAAIFRYYYIFSIAVLALLGTRDLAEAAARSAGRIPGRLLIAAAIVSALAVGTFLLLTATMPNPGGYETVAYVHLVTVWAGVLSLAILMSRARSRRLVRSFAVLFPLLATTDALITAALSKDTIMNAGGHPLAPSPDRWRNLDRRHDPRIHLTQAGLYRQENSCLDPSCEVPSNDQMITKQAVFSAYSPQENLFHKEMTLDGRLRRMAVGADRIWFASHAEVVAPTTQNFAALRDRAKVLGTAPLVVHFPDAMLQISARSGAANEWNIADRINRLTAAEHLAANVLRYEPSELVLRVHTPSDGWLLVTDRWARGWRAEVNGKPATVFGGNFIFRAVQILAGDNDVRFWYRSSGFPWLLIVSWGTLAAIGGLAVQRGFRNRASGLRAAVDAPASLPTSH